MEAITTNTITDVNIVKLADGATLPIPSNVKILNPEEEGRRKNLHFVWFVNCGNPCQQSFEDALSGVGPCPVYGWFSDSSQLREMSDRKSPATPFEPNPARVDFRKMRNMLFEAAMPILPRNTRWTFAWARYGWLGVETPVNKSAFRLYMKGLRNE